MFFASDNGGPVPPQVLAALAEANEGYALGYGADALMDEVRALLRDIFEAPEAEVFLVATGTAANALALATLAHPFDTVFCSPVAHIHEDECNAPEFFTGGAKLTLVAGGDRMTPDALRSAIEGEETRGVHGPRRGPVSITQVTERGKVYTLDELRALTAVARDYGLNTHLDGARFANALVTLGCTPAEMTWKAGIDVVSFGGTKNGLMGCEAVIFFDPEDAAWFEHRRKRGAHLFSKHRYLSAQMAAYLRDDLWLDLAQKANGAMARLAHGLRKSNALVFENDPVANMLFFNAPSSLHAKALAAGAVYYVMGDMDGGSPDAHVTGRLVTDWSTPNSSIDSLIRVLTSA